MRGRREGHINRTECLKIMVRPEEKAALQEKAKAAGFKNLSAFVRAAAGLGTNTGEESDAVES